MKRALLLGACVLFELSIAAAQYPPYRRPWGGGYGGYGGGYSFGGGSTAAGSYATGMSNMVRAAGQYNEMTAQAAISAQQAQSLALDNKMKSTETYFAMRKLNQEATAAERARLSGNSSGKYTAHIARPQQLSPSQLDPVTGQINWMPVLLDEVYAPQRMDLQNIFMQRAQSQLSDSTYTDVAQLTGAMQTELDKHVKELKPQDFVDARRFLTGLASEARYSGFAAPEVASALPVGAQPASTPAPAPAPQ